MRWKRIYGKNMPEIVNISEVLLFFWRCLPDKDILTADVCRMAKRLTHVVAQFVELSMPGRIVEDCCQ